MSEHVTQWMLEAEMSALRSPDAERAAHLRECEHCQAALRRVLRGYEQLDEGLDTLRRRRRISWWWAPAPLAAAAVLALLLTRTTDETPVPPTRLAQLMFPPATVVEPSAGQQAVVMEHDGMTVIWLTNNQGKQ